MHANVIQLYKSLHFRSLIPIYLKYLNWKVLGELMVIFGHVSHLLQVLRGSNQTQRKHQANKKKSLKVKEIFDFHPSHFHLQPPGAKKQTAPESHYTDSTHLSV